MYLSEKCHCNKLEDILANITSHHTLVNITGTKVTLSSVIRIPNNYPCDISIIGHNNLTVNCANKGGLIIHCDNVMIKDITWIRCGVRSPDSVSVIEVSSYKTTIQNCIFQHSLYSSVIVYDYWAELEVLIVNSCKFVNNNHHKGHGAAIYVRYTLFLFCCKFCYNKQL